MWRSWRDVPCRVLCVSCIRLKELSVKLEFTAWKMCLRGGSGACALWGWEDHGDVGPGVLRLVSGMRYLQVLVSIGDYFWYLRRTT